jgi:CheY-like chemotaxis protein/CHASE3 domain sensor protein/putative methionine-R-sulfoxide reductase with GAF domain
MLSSLSQILKKFIITPNRGLMKLTLDKKILGGFIICSLSLLIVASISFKNSEEFLYTSSLVNRTHELIYELDQILFSSVNAETGARGFVITNDENYLAPFNNSKLKLFEHIQKARELAKNNIPLLQNIDSVERLATTHVKHLERKIEARKIGFEQAKEIVLTGEGKRIQDEIRKIVGHVKTTEQNLLEERRQASEEDARNFNLVFSGLLALVLIVLITVYLIIISNLRALRKAEADAANRNWNLGGSAELAKAMQGNKSLQELSQVIINHMGTYLNAQIGALYVAEEDGMHLKLCATYAFDQRKNTPGVIKFGEGIVGQCAAENKFILITDVPDNYFIINTGFGAVLPKSIIIIPFTIEGTVVGVVELGSMFSFSELHKEYLRLSMSSIAIGITAAVTRQKTRELLEETQRQAEELEAQQEELKQANDELHKKTELLEDSESELKAQQQELQQVNVELEEKATMLEEQKRRLEGAKTEIENKAKEIENTSKYKSEFLANMSHELRTPLNSILILAQLLSENKNNRLGQKETEFAKNIFNSGTDLLNLINEILDLSKVEAGKMELDIAEVPVQDIIENISSMFSEIAKSRAVDFEIDYRKEDIPFFLISDQQRVEQILKNLLSNAFKFTSKEGKVTLAAGAPVANIQLKSEHLKKAGNVVSFSVIDNGIGIPRDKQKIIFEAFQQADGSTKRKYGGTGLGLSISRELAHILGGEIHLQSEVGKGSVFTLYLPLRFNSSFTSTDRPIEVKPKGSEISNGGIEMSKTAVFDTTNMNDDHDNILENDRIVLIIEDDKQFAQVLVDFIHERGYKAIIASQGNTGVSFARHYKPDAILLDMNLPVMDGMEVLKQIKNDPALRHIPVQIISSYDKKKEGLELGAFDYLQKPVHTSDLHKAFEKIERFTSKKLKKLLIIEDNKNHNNAIKELIGNGDVKSFSAYSGEEAHKMLEAESFDCIIIDLGLPDMSGFELLEKIKENNRYNKIPIIVYTGKDLKKEDNIRLNKLADTVVLKTANSQERLLDETMLFLHRVESQLPKEKQTIIRKLHKADEVLRDKKILLVDDDIRNIYSLTNALENEGLHCVIAENGRVAIEALKKNPDIDLVLMDVMMPEMDGHEATMEIRKVNAFKNLPIIALTAKAMKGDKEKCLAAGMSDYISKPVNIDQLLSLMRVWLYAH